MTASKKREIGCYHPVSGCCWGNSVLSSEPAMQKGKEALLLHLGVSLHLCSTILLPCHCLLCLATLLHALTPFLIFISPLSTPLYMCEKHPSPAHSLLSARLHSQVNSDFLSSFSSCSNAPVGTLALCGWRCSLAQRSVLRPRGVLLLLLLQTGGTGQCAGLERWTAGGLEASVG